MLNQTYQADVLVVGGGVGGTAAAIQAARRGAKTILVSEFAWLGGMLTSAGVSVPDGNELEAFQTGLWGEFLRELQQRQPEGLDHSWVSFFSFDPRIGAQIFADWVQELANLHWIAGEVPLEVLREGSCVTGVRFSNFTVKAKITLDGTELGDLLALAEIRYRWGWEWQEQWEESSAPDSPNHLTEKYPVQAPTGVVLMQDFGTDTAPEIPPAPNYDPSLFVGAWDNYGAEQFINYGRLPGGLLMMNWPICGNDYGADLGRLVDSRASRDEFIQESRWHSQNFAHFIQNQLGRRYGLATQVFPHSSSAFALHPYYRESRRLVGLKTITEQDILPVPGGQVAPLNIDTIAIANYPNDHHYPGFDFPLQPKSIRWGGRWTGTPFTIPYSSLIPINTDGFLACEKNISVSHIANGATRLQPVVMGIGQAAGMAAAMCIEFNCQPRDLPVKTLQIALIQDKRSPAAVIPLFNLTPTDNQWRQWQTHYLHNPVSYPLDGNFPVSLSSPYYYDSHKTVLSRLNNSFRGVFHAISPQNYRFSIITPKAYQKSTWQLVTLRSHIDLQLKACNHQQLLTVWGRLNHSGNWLLVEYMDI